MNPRWLLIRRLRGPVFLLTFAATALLHQWDILGFSQSWPLYLIVAGALTLAERAAMAGQPPTPPYPGATPYANPGPYQGQPYGAPPAGTPYSPVHPQPGTAVVPAIPGTLEHRDPQDDFNRGGRS